MIGGADTTNIPEIGLSDTGKRHEMFLTQGFCPIYPQVVAPIVGLMHVRKLPTLAKRTLRL